MNRINVTSDIYCNLNTINMEFLNGGKITIPSDYGGYVVASGCGSGKTTIIKEIIRTQRYKGILYAASTIKECNEMYEWVKEMYISEGLSDIVNDDIIVLHSDYRSEGTDNNLWRNNPDKLAEKSVIICTHYKLLNKFPELLIRYKGNPLNYDDISYTQRAVMDVPEVNEKGELVVYQPRQLILIDELPICDSMSIKIDRSIIRLVGYKRTYITRDKSGKIISLPIDPVIYDRPGFKFMESQYDNEVSNNLKFIKDTDSLSSFKKKMILSIIYDNYDELIKRKEDEIRIKYNASNLVASSYMRTRIILFDGTGDLTFIDSKRFRLLTFPNKYNSPISLNRIEYNLKRYQKPNSDEILIKNELEKNILKLKEIIDNNPEGTLIVTWMNLKEDNYRITKGTLNITNNLLNEEFSLPEYYKERLEQLGVTNPFEIIHYMSGLDKATNKFRNFSSIVFLGEFHVPEYVIAEFNCDYSCNTNSDNYLTYQLVQAVCRTRIRNHNGESINIYYTEDWSERKINNLIDYISSNKVIKKDVSFNFIKPKWRNQCKELMKINKEFRDMIEMKEGGKCYFTLNDIYNALPLNEKKIRSYYPMINYFRKLGIEITIKSEDTKFTSINNPRI